MKAALTVCPQQSKVRDMTEKLEAPSKDQHKKDIAQENGARQSRRTVEKADDEGRWVVESKQRDEQRG